MKMRFFVGSFFLPGFLLKIKRTRIRAFQDSVESSFISEYELCDFECVPTIQTPSALADKLLKQSHCKTASTPVVKEWLTNFGGDESLNVEFFKLVNGYWEMLVA